MLSSNPFSAWQPKSIFLKILINHVNLLIKPFETFPLPLRCNINLIATFIIWPLLSSPVPDLFFFFFFFPDCSLTCTLIKIIVKIQQEFFFTSQVQFNRMFFVRILCKPSHTHKSHANAKYQLEGTKAELVCTMWRTSVSAVVINGGKPYTKRQPESTIWPQVQVHRTGGQAGLSCPAATQHAYLNCEQT